MSLRLPKSSVARLMILVAMVAVTAAGYRAWRHYRYCLLQADLYRDQSASIAAMNDALNIRLSVLALQDDEDSRSQKRNLLAYQQDLRSKLDELVTAERSYRDAAYQPWRGVPAGK